jgi:hypothetical protein
MSNVYHRRACTETKTFGVVTTSLFLSSHPVYIVEVQGSAKGGFWSVEGVAPAPKRGQPSAKWGRAREEHADTWPLFLQHQSVYCYKL